MRGCTSYGGVYKLWGGVQVMGGCTSYGGVYKLWGGVQVMGEVYKLWEGVQVMGGCTSYRGGGWRPLGGNVTTADKLLTACYET